MAPPEKFETVDNSDGHCRQENTVPVLRFLFMEPFFGGSHREFAQGLKAHSRHHIDLITLPPRFWKWRMRGAALHFIKTVSALETYDGLITTDLMSLADFKALAGPTCPPVWLYFHENQLTYPTAPGERMDVHFGFTDITSGLAADRVCFNSRTHRESFFKELPIFLSRLPEYRPGWVIQAIREKTEIHYPGCRFPMSGHFSKRSGRCSPLIIWNHRWEFDKNPASFFNALKTAADSGLDFKLALLGENFQTVPQEFIRARRQFASNIVQYGHVKRRSAYLEWLARGDIVISTALQENFGISVVEATGMGCLPLLPNRLSYPEIIPEAFHEEVLYHDEADLAHRLCRLLSDLSRHKQKCTGLAECMQKYAWPNLIEDYDKSLADMVAQSPH